MSTRTTMDGNTAVAHVAYRVNEVCAIYPITPSSTMAELADQWMAEGRPNIWGNIPVVQEMQSEGGAAGAVHGALQSGALTTTFTASQGLMLMLPNMFKIAGELTSTVFHVAARSLATSALSIFGDHSDVMTARTTGFALLSSASVQEAHDSALIAQMATLEARIPFLHFFDGFRTSHELNTLDLLSDADIRSMIDDDLVRAHRSRALTPEHPFIRGTAHNPDTYFQAREAANPYYERVPGIVERAMERFGALTGRHYNLFEYDGDPAAERVLILMGSGAETARQTVAALRAAGEKVGVLQVRLYRPFSVSHMLAVLPTSVRRIAVLEQTKESGATGEPLYQDVVTSLASAVSRGQWAVLPLVIGGRYGISSKDFTPAMVQGHVRRAEDQSTARQLHRRHQRRSEPYEPRYRSRLRHRKPRCHARRVLRAGRGRHGRRQQEQREDHRRGRRVVRPRLLRLRFTQIGGADHLASPLRADADQGAVSRGTGRLRRLPPIRLSRAPEHPPRRCTRRHLPHQCPLRRRGGLGASAASGATDHHREGAAPVRHRCLCRRPSGWAGRATNTVLQTCFFAISGVLPRERAIAHIKEAIRKTYGSKGQSVIDKNFAAVDGTLLHLHEVTVPALATSTMELPPARAGECIRIRQVRHGAHVRRRGRRDRRQPHAGRWYVPLRHQRPMRNGTSPRSCPIGGRNLLHSVRANAASSVRTASSVRATITKTSSPARRTASSRRRSMRVDIRRRGSRCNSTSRTARAAACASRLAPRRARRNRTSCHQHGGEAADSGAGADEHRLLRDLADQRPGPGRFRQCPGRAVSAAALRIPRRLRGLRRDAYLKLLSQLFGDRLQIANATRVFLDLRRQPARHALDHEPRGARAGLVELPVRG